MTERPIIGYGGGKGGGGGQRAPIEDPDSLRSRAYARVIDLLSEGEIEGLATPARPLQSVYLDRTPVQNEDASFNFKGVTIATRPGTQGQNYLKGFPSVEAEVAVGVQVTQSTPVVRTISSSAYDAARVTISIPQLSRVNTNNGDTTGTDVRITIEVQPNGGSYVQQINDLIRGKSTSKYQKSYLLDLTGSPPWNIRVNRITDDSTSATLQNQTWWESLTQITNAKLTYPNSALAAMVIDSQQFANIPVRGFDIKGLRIRIPSNATVRADGSLTYSGSWDGTFQIAWSSNPAWCFYDMLTNERYGLGQYVSADQIDKWALYSIGQYCDELVDDGFGGTEPRFSCNLYLQQRAEAFKVMQDMASIFRGMAYWASGQLTAVQDAPSDPVALFADANVISADENGNPLPAFTYQGSSLKTRHTVALVSWNDPDDYYTLKPEYVEDADAIARYGVVQTSVVAVGCTSRSQAHRVGKWLLYSESNETETVTFKAGLDAALVRPGQIIQVADKNRAGARRGGRVMATGLIRTNVITNGQAAGAVVGGALPTNWAVESAAGLTTSVVAIWTDVNGVGGVRLRVQGTASGTSYIVRWQPITSIAAVAGQSWTSGIHVALNAGTLTNITAVSVGMSERTAAGASIAGAASSTAITGLTIAPQRFTHSRTLTSGSTAFIRPSFSMTVTNGAAIDVTIDIGGASMEQSDTSPQYIRTDGAQRSALADLTVDQGFTPTAGVTYTFSAMLPDGTIASCPIASIAGNVITLNTAQPGSFNVAPQVNAMWLVNSTELALQTFRVISVVDAGDGFEISALKHNPGKFSAVENGVILTENPISVQGNPPDPPSNVAIAESLYTSNGTVRVLVSVSWTAPARASTYDITYSRDDSPPVTVTGLLSPILDIRDAVAGTYSVSVVAKSITGKPSSAALATQVVLGKTAPPADVRNFTLANIAGGVAQLTWAQASDLDVQFGGYIRIRHTPETTSPDWSNAIDIGPALPGNTTMASVPHLPGTYLARFVDSSGKQSVNAVSARSSIANLLQFNVISTLTQNPSFSGTKANTVVDGTLGGLRIDSLSTIQAPTLDQWQYLNNFTVVAAGTYDFASTDLGAVYTSRLSADIRVTGFDTSNQVDSWPSIDAQPDIDGGLVDNVNAILLVRTTNDNPSGSPVWSPWQPFFTGQYSARAFQFKLALISGGSTRNILVTALSVTIDMPDRVESANNVTSGAGALAVTFPAAFQATPSIAINPRNIGTGEYYTVTAQSRTGFTVTFFNAAGTAISRNFDWMAKGYGVAS